MIANISPHSTVTHQRVSSNNTPRPSVQAPDEVVVYHWNRIIFAGILLVALIIAAVIAVNSLLEDETASISTEAASSESTIAGLEPSALPERAKEKVTEVSLEKPEIKPAANKVSEQIEEESVGETKELVADSTEKSQDVNITLAKPTQEKTKLNKEPSLASAVKPKTLAATSETASEIKPAQPIQNENTALMEASLFSDIETQVYSKNIKSFVLAERVKKKLPIGSIHDIRLDHNKIATVYAHSEADGLKDEILHYVWILNGKKIAKVRSGVWGDSWRSYSSKFINPQMKGDWKVELQNNKGEVLAASSFHY